MVGEFINPKKCYIKFYKKRERERESNGQDVFESVVAVAFQSVFNSEMHQNNILFFKFIFDINASKRFKNTKKILILNKKNKFFLKTIEQLSKHSLTITVEIDC
jgi:hypothetical protein